MVDEWLYIDAAQEFSKTGRLDIAAISFAPAIFEAVFGGAVLTVTGGSMAALVVATAFLAALAGASLWDLLTRSGVAPALTLLTVGAFLFAGVFYGLSTTYMTDAHALSLVIISAALYSRGIDEVGEGHWWLLGGSIAAVLAYSSRPGSIAVVVGVAVVAASRRQWASLAWSIGLPAVLVCVHLVGQWWGFLPPPRSDLLDRVRIPSWSTLRDAIFVVILSVGIWLLPLVGVIGGSIVRRVREGSVMPQLIWGSLALIFLLLVGDIPEVGNWINRTGMFPIDESTAGTRSLLVGQSAYVAIVVVGSMLSVAAFASVVGGRIHVRLRSAEIGLWAAACCSLVLVGFTQVAAWERLLDRYAVVLLPAVLFTFAVRGSGGEALRFQRLGFAILAITASVTVILAIDGARLQNAIFLEAESAVDLGIDEEAVDGGAAWTGITFGSQMEPEDIVFRNAPDWWRTVFAPGIEPRYVVTMNPKVGRCVIASREIQTMIGPDSRVGLVDTSC